MRLMAIALLLICVTQGMPAHAAPPTKAAKDPLQSARWEDMRQLLFKRQRVVFDERVKVVAPLTAENALNVPIRVDASALPGVRKVVVFADNNPITEILRFYPGLSQPNLGFRAKLQQSTPVRAAAQTADGVWHLGGVWVATAGGGCTAASFGSASLEWQRRLNEVSGRLWSREPEAGAAANQQRLRLRIIHPMDTGLADGIPAFFIEELKLTDAHGQLLMRIESLEPVSENPVFTLDIPAGHEGGRVEVSGRDNNGNLIKSWIEP